MPTIDENIQMWETNYDWSQAGDEWSETWGSPRAQWEGCLLPRIFPFLRGRILEIAPGCGRWTQFLNSHCVSLIGIDLSPSCVEQCKQRFRDYANLEFKVNEGLLLPMVDDASIDFAFSYDSLVHAESDVLSSYVNELARVLKPGGVAFIHHSNLGSVANRRLLWKFIQNGVARIRSSNFRGILRSLRNTAKRQSYGIAFSNLRNPDRRAPSMSANRMRGFVERSGMSCLQQELVPWGDTGQMLTDCMSTIINRPGTECVIIENHRFMEEAAAIKRISTYI
jgi:SAM-dependent methyltransferase